jgi:type I restriction enzyme S subunit
MNLPSLPKHWNVARISDLAVNRKHALTIGPFGSDLKTSDYRDCGVPIVFVRDVQPNSFSPKTRQYVSERKARELAAHAVRPGDLVVTKMGLPPCVAAVYPDSEPPGIVTADIIKISVDDAKLDRKYAAYFLNTELAKSQIAGITFGITRPKVTLRDFKEVRVPLPPLAEQRRIAEVLDRAEALRAKRRAVLMQMDVLRQAVFLEMFGDPATNPKNWPELNLGQLLESASYGTSEKASSAGEIPVLRMNNITRTGELDITDLKYMNLPAERYERFTVRLGDILFNRTNSPELVGKTAVVRIATRMAYAGYLIRLRTTAENDPEYLGGFLNSAYAKRTLRGMCKSIIGMANINATELQSMRVAQPPLPLQREFGRRVAAIERLKVAQRASLAEVDALFASLQHRAFRGEL